MKTSIFTQLLALVPIAGAICNATATSTPPITTTLPATVVTPNQATLNGMVNPHGLPETAYFRYGLNTNYGNVSASSAVPVAYYPPNTTAISFNGTSQNATVPGFGNYAPTNEITIEFWQYVANANQQSTFILNPDNSADRINAHVPWIDGTVYWDFGNIGGSGRLAYGTSAVIGAWNHMALVASQSGNFMNIYRNGVLEAQKTGMTPFTRYAADLLLAGGTVNNYFFKGALAEFRVWNKALDSATIQVWMLRTLTNTHPAWTNLVAYWPMNEGSGATLNDLSGNGHTAFLSNAPVWVVVTNSPVSMTVTGLTAGTTYHYQCVATNGGSFGDGSDLTFTTPSVGGIIWNPPSTITGDGDVYAVGAPVYAYDWANTNRVVNGVSFTGTASFGGSTNVGTTLNDLDPAAFNSGANPFGGLSSEYKSVLVGGAYNVTVGNTVTLSNLVSGHPYAVQVWVNDPRGTQNNRTETLTSAGGNLVMLNYSTTNGSIGGAPGQFALGYFTATSSVQTFTITGNQIDQLNALQLRDLSVVGGRPIVTTGPAGNLQPGSATLNATVNPNTFATSIWFRWGTTTNYGNVTAPAMVPAGISTLAVSNNLSALQPGITYHFAVVAANSAGTNIGADQIFSVPAPVLQNGGPPVLFSNFAPNYGYSYGYASRFVARSFYLAMSFKANFTAPVAQILVPIYNVIPPSQLRFTLKTDNAGVPGATLETWSVNNPTYGALTPLQSVNRPVLTQGTKYWLVASADDPITESYWWLGPLGAPNSDGASTSTDQGNTWTADDVYECAFEVDPVNPVITSIAAAQSNLVLTASGGIAGHTYLTLMGTNLNQPHSLWQPVATNVVNLNGPFTIFATNAANPAASQRYYILKMQ